MEIQINPRSNELFLVRDTWKVMFTYAEQRQNKSRNGIYFTVND